MKSIQDLADLERLSYLETFTPEAQARREYLDEIAGYVSKKKPKVSFQIADLENTKIHMKVSFPKYMDDWHENNKFLNAYGEAIENERD